MTTKPIESFSPGQCWLSEAEPELGLGFVAGLANRRVRIVFPACDETREYAITGSPLRRVSFTCGDKVSDGKEIEFVVERIEEQGGCLIYYGDNKSMAESNLNPSLASHTPLSRLQRGEIDAVAAFILRLRSLRARARAQKSGARGFLGGRIVLLPHQLYVAQEVTGRAQPRALLSDEIGLGKTIEACLILHCLLLNGRVKRALIITPESLVHQWFVELLRRFALKVTIFNEESCPAGGDSQEDKNPFWEDTLALTSIRFLADNPERALQAIKAQWDMVIVDEAHHLAWVPGRQGTAYQIVEQLAAVSPGLLLLTATPEEMGLESHFARLRLLDPHRYNDLECFCKEAERYSEFTALAEKLPRDKPLTKSEIQLLKRLGLNKDDSRQHLISQLLDRYGPGRIIFRNTRRRIKGFPGRQALLSPLEGPEGEYRVKWLADLLRQVAPDKVLLICHHPDQAIELSQSLREHIQVKTAVFHERLTLIQRDRNAAWFAEEDGARLLIASEIGGEGRNFQFAHRLVLYDLPVNPEVLEQRIGRLDRIGQKNKTIYIHVPYIPGSREEALARWHHEGLDSFEKPVQGACWLLEKLGPELERLENAVGSGEWNDFISETQASRDEIRRKLLHGKDRLLELQSFRVDEARTLVDEIENLDADLELDAYLFDVFEYYGIYPEQIDERQWFLKSDNVLTDAFPGFPVAGMTVTSSRSRALEREDMGFLTWDHPMVTGATELVLGSSTGSCSVAYWPDEGKKELLVEAVYVLEPLAVEGGDICRYMPPTPIRILVDQSRANRTGGLPDEKLEKMLQKEPCPGLVDRVIMIWKIIPGMLESAGEAAEAEAKVLRTDAVAAAHRLIGGEIKRLQALRCVNDHVCQEEIDYFASLLASIEVKLYEAPLRLDALRIIFRGPGGF